MKLVYNKFIPIQGYKYMNIGGLIFTRSKRLADPANWKPVDYNHEAIHTAQWKECLYIFYPLIYLIGYIIKGFEYRDNPLEKEAYDNQDNLEYLKTRKLFAWLR